MAYDTFAYGEKTTLSIGSAIANVLSIELSDLSVAKVGKTVLGDTRKKFRPSALVDCGELTFTLQYTPDSDNTWLTDLKSGTKLTSVVLTFYSDDPSALDTLTWSDAYVIKWGLGNVKEDANVECKVTLGFNDTPTTGSGGSGS